MAIPVLDLTVGLTLGPILTRGHLRRGTKDYKQLTRVVSQRFIAACSGKSRAVKSSTTWRR